ncbi:MAG: putative basic amino acid antiporter YfcC [Idiomarina sp.]|nr:putative basic amino acid antiporter YfcC [Idiomarina sp.]
MKSMEASRRMPDTLVILFFVTLLAAALTWLVPAGQFSTETVTRDTPSGLQERELILAESYEVVEGARGFRWFAEGGEIGLANVPFEGMVSGSKWGAAIGVMAFIILVGGAFGIIVKTASIERGILALIQRTQAYDRLFLVVLFFVFSLGGAIFGMGEEAIAFCLVLLPVMTKLGYDKVTTVLVTYVATQIGFAASWMNPFSVAIAQGIAEVPLLSGANFRMTMWLVFTLVGLAFTLRYAGKVRQPVAERPTVNFSQQPFSRLDSFILITFLLGMIWVVWGVTARGYYIPEIASQFVAVGIVIGLIAIVGGRMTANGMSTAFTRGAQDLLPAALIVGFAKGIILLLGGDDPTSPSTLNTVLHAAGQSVSGLSEMGAAVAMLTFQGVFNFFMTSGSGQAALTMPLMAPLADLAGVSRQVAVLAFQLGDGLTNIIVPTSAALIGCLGAVKLDWASWVRAIWKFQLVLAAVAIATVVIAVLLGFS